MGVKERRQREKTQVREKILDAALEFFAREGVEGVTMRALADAIEYSPPVIYAHFRDKDAIIRELCNRQIRGLAQAFSTFGALDPVERLRRIGYAYTDFAVEHPSHFRFLFLTEHALPDELGDDPEQNAYAFLKQTVKDGLAAGVFRAGYTDAEEIAQLCWGGAHGLVALHNIKAEASWIEWRDARTSARRLIDATLDGIVKPEAAKRAARPASRRAPVRRSSR
ncbi:MAG TPA: TetR/AcrR family transcriptional regulator [Gemmatimonadaceae bacterium]|jgi:AcrR family transcriptional regulator|nr:TetR/AcrR family transcriptional regulator [Gemmatimonadaceae bacterium]